VRAARRAGDRVAAGVSMHCGRGVREACMGASMRCGRGVRRAGVLSALLAASALLASFAALTPSALAEGAGPVAERARLDVGLRPDRAGKGSEIRFAFQIAAAGGALPAALTKLDVQLPKGTGIDTAGIATCKRGRVLHRGVSACSKDAVVGGGSVLVRVPLGEVTRRERAKLTVFHGTSLHGRDSLLFFAVGKVPIATRLAFSGVIVPSAHGPLIEASIPLIPTLPEQPDAAIVGLTSKIGTLGRSYERMSHGRRVPFTPGGVTLPRRCRRVLRFRASFTFVDGGTASAGATARCRG